MRRLHTLLLFTALLSSCTFVLPDLTHLILSATHTPPPLHVPTGSPVASQTQSLTPTISTATFTLTPTSIGGQPTAIESSAPSATPTVIQLVLGSALTQTSFVKGFVSIILSGPEIRWGGCAPSSATISAQVSEPFEVAQVSVFMKLQSKTSGGSTEWDAGTLIKNQGSGTFVHTIEAASITDYQNFTNAWVFLQLITTGGNARIRDRTPVFSSALSLLACA